MVGLENLDERDAKSDARFTPSPSEDLFDRLAWWYTECRERLLQDDTESIVQILASFGLKLNGARLLELGCGPGFYATRIAGYEAIHMIRKGQACWSAAGAKVGLLHRFIVSMFGIEA
jgi:hypothetical protein